MSEPLIEDHPFVAGDPNYGWERQCGYHVVIIGVGIGEESGVSCCCGYPPERHAESIPRGVYEAGLADRRRSDSPANGIE